MKPKSEIVYCQLFQKNIEGNQIVVTFVGNSLLQIDSFDSEGYDFLNNQVYRVYDNYKGNLLQKEEQFACVFKTLSDSQKEKHDSDYSMELYKLLKKMNNTNDINILYDLANNFLEVIDNQRNEKEKKYKESSLIREALKNSAIS